jgi:hypothetical protein
VNLLVVVLAVSGALFGVAADRLAVRWPEHDEEEPAGRPIGWRTVASAAMGALVRIPQSHHPGVPAEPTHAGPAECLLRRCGVRETHRGLFGSWG